MRFDASLRHFHFPSSSSIAEMDARYYFPEQSKFTKDSTGIEATDFTSTTDKTSLFTETYE